VQYECLNWRQSEICIVINDKSKGNIAKYLSYDGLLHCKFIIQFVNERTSKIGQHVAKLQAKWLIVSYAPFALHVCPQRCRTRHISKITYVLRTKTVTNYVCVIDTLMSAYYQQISNCCRPV